MGLSNGLTTCMCSAYGNIEPQQCTMYLYAKRKPSYSSLLEVSITRMVHVNQKFMWMVTCNKTYDCSMYCCTHYINSIHLSFFTSVEVGLASRLISASLFKCTLLATALITDSTVLGFIKLGVPVSSSWLCHRRNDWVSKHTSSKVYWSHRTDTRFFHSSVYLCHKTFGHFFVIHGCSSCI